MFNQKLTIEEKIIKTKIQLQDSHPFWAYLILKLNIQEDVNNIIPPWGGAGVDIKGNVYWKRDFFEKLSDEEIKFVLAHEVGHLVFAHLLRLNGRDPMLFNATNDIVMNNILIMNGFQPCKQGLIPTCNSIDFLGIKIIDIDKKTSEQVYDEVYNEAKDKIQYIQSGMDVHIYGNGDLTEEQKEKIGERWKDNVLEAAVYAKQRGQLPKGMESLIGSITNPKHNWKHMLRKYITNTLPYDYSFSRPNRKIPGIILPGVIKETIDIVVHIDTSGSISENELNEFMSEIIGMAQSHQNLNMTLIECDAAIQQVIQVNSRNVSKLRKINIKGRGGTSHKPVWMWIKKNKPNCKLIVSLTDLYSDVEKSDNPKCNVLWIIHSRYSKDTQVPFGQVLLLR